MSPVDVGALELLSSIDGEAAGCGSSALVSQSYKVGRLSGEIVRLHVQNNSLKKQLGELKYTFGGY